MNTQLAKWGNSLAVRLPKSAIEQAGFKEGDQLKLQVNENGEMLLRRAPRKYSLDELVRGITEENRPTPIDWGKPVGREAW